MRWDRQTAELALEVLGKDVPPIFGRALNFFREHPTNEHCAIVRDAFANLPPDRQVEIRLEIAAEVEARREDDTDPTPGLTRLEKEHHKERTAT